MPLRGRGNARPGAMMSMACACGGGSRGTCRVSQGGIANPAPRARKAARGHDAHALSAAMGMADTGRWHACRTGRTGDGWG
ncbi:hypothetical protein CFR73_10510 [Novacetimonas maltaceti]|nr:hypothetical protein CFR73_10510 [Novacetimonas maltaceti]